MKKLAAAALALVLLGPSFALVGIGVLMNPASTAACTVTGNGITIGDVPESLTVTTANGETFTLNNRQLTHPRQSSRPARASTGLPGTGSRSR